MIDFSASYGIASQSLVLVKTADRAQRAGGWYTEGRYAEPISQEALSGAAHVFEEMQHVARLLEGSAATR